MSLPSERTGDELPEREPPTRIAPSRPISALDHKIIALLLQAYDNQEIADALGMKIRTVKAHFAKLYRRFGIYDGIKRVKLAVMLYQAELAKGEGGGHA